MTSRLILIVEKEIVLIGDTRKFTVENKYLQS